MGIKDGSRLELKVAVKGDPDPQVTWTKDGKPISSSEIMEVKYKNGSASVLINEVFPEDGGKYTCRATNTKGSVETSSKVVILPMEKKVTNGAVEGGDRRRRCHPECRRQRLGQVRRRLVAQREG